MESHTFSSPDRFIPNHAADLIAYPNALDLFAVRELNRRALIQYRERRVNGQANDIAFTEQGPLTLYLTSLSRVMDLREMLGDSVSAYTPLGPDLFCLELTGVSAHFDPMFLNLSWSSGQSSIATPRVLRAERGTQLWQSPGHTWEGQISFKKAA